MGAWIEMTRQMKSLSREIVAPLVGAWIEIVPLSSHLFASDVAPLVGAWIEIKVTHFYQIMD